MLRPLLLKESHRETIEEIQKGSSKRTYGYRRLHELVKREEYQTAHKLAEQLLTLAQQTQDPGMLLAAHRALGSTLFYLGETAFALTHYMQGMALYDPHQ